MIGRSNRLGMLGIGLGMMLAAGCTSRPTLIPNIDPQLRKTSAQFAADSAKRFPFKADTPKGEPMTVRAQVDYTMKILDVANLTKEDWTDVEVWANRKYVVFIHDWKATDKNLKRLAFEMMFDENGNYFPTDNSKIRITQVELIKDGKLYDVPVRLTD